MRRKILGEERENGEDEWKQTKKKLEDEDSDGDWEE